MNEILKRLFHNKGICLFIYHYEIDHATADPNDLSCIFRNKFDSTILQIDDRKVQLGSW